MLKVLTRRELYDLVWDRPMSKVAAEIGISDVALHKICDKHRVPAPGRGYWAKLAAGKPVQKAAFREIGDQALNRIEIVGAHHRSLPQSVIEAHARAKAEIKKPVPALTPNVMVSGSPHPLLEPMRQKLLKAKAETDGFVRTSGGRYFSAAIAPTSADRLLAILKLLVHAAEARGHRFQSQEGGLALMVDGEPLTVEITEKVDRVAHHPTEQEQRKLNRWELETERKRRHGQWISEWDKPQIPEWDFVPNGCLVFEIDKGQHRNGLRRRFSDGQRARLETLIDEILIAAVTLIEARRAKRAEDERREREFEAAEKRRCEAERRRVLHTTRWEFLERQIEYNELAQRIECFIKDYSSRHPDESLPPSVRLLIQWARSYAHDVRDAIAPNKLVATLEKYRLMDDATEIGSWVKFD